MNTNEERSGERAALLYELLVDEGVVEDKPNRDGTEHHTVVHHAITELAERSEAFYGNGQRSKATRNLGRVGFLQAYMEGRSPDELHHVIDELGWSKGHKDLDLLALQSLAAYPKLLKEIEQRQLEDEVVSDIALEDETAFVDMDDVILGCIEQGRIPRGYGGQLRLYLGKAEAPLDTPNDVIVVAYAQGAGKLRADVTRFLKVHKYTGDVPIGMKFLEQISYANDIGAIAMEHAPRARKDAATLGQVSRMIETRMAEALEVLYPTR